MPYFSIIMAAKNEENFITTSINSYLNQTFQNWELIVVNDYSTDRTLQKAREMAKKDQRIRVFELKKSTGISAARGLGIRNAKSEIIVIGDADDFAKPKRLAIIYSTFKENPNCQCFYSKCSILYHGKDKIVTRPFQSFNKELLKKINFIPDTSSAFIKTAYLSVGGYNKALRLGMDYDLWLKFIDRNYCFCYSNECLMTYRIHSKSLRGTLKRKDHKKYLEKIRNFHHLTTPKQEEVKKLTTRSYWQYLSTPGGLKLWFG